MEREKERKSEREREREIIEVKEIEHKNLTYDDYAFLLR